MIKHLSLTCILAVVSTELWLSIDLCDVHWLTIPRNKESRSAVGTKVCYSFRQRYFINRQCAWLMPALLHSAWTMPHLAVIKRQKYVNSWDNAIAHHVHAFFTTENCHSVRTALCRVCKYGTGTRTNLFKRQNHEIW